MDREWGGTPRTREALAHHGKVGIQTGSPVPVGAGHRLHLSPPIPVTDHNNLSSVDDRAVILDMAYPDEPGRLAAKVVVLIGDALIQLEYAATMSGQADVGNAAALEWAAKSAGLVITRDALNQLA